MKWKEPGKYQQTFCRLQRLDLHAALPINQFKKGKQIELSHTILVYLLASWCVHITSTIELLMAVWHGINLAGATWKCNTEKWKLRNEKLFNFDCYNAVQRGSDYHNHY